MARRLTNRQRARIANIQEQRRRRLSNQVEQTLSKTDAHSSKEGRVLTQHGSTLIVSDSAGNWHQCMFRQNIGQPVCGDQVVWSSTGDGSGIVTALQSRLTMLSRPDYLGRDKPLAANITQMVVVFAPAPAPSGFLLDQYLVAAELIGVKAIIALNKMDLLNKDGTKAFLGSFKAYEAIGYPVIPISLKQDHGLDPLLAGLQHETSILLGQSGVGKSSLVKSLLPERDVQIGRLSESTGFGRHTTSVTTCYVLPHGGELIDSPGVRSFRLGKIDRHQLEQGFREIRGFIGQCQFANCRHDREPDCAVRSAVEQGKIAPSRLISFQQMAQKL